MDKPLHIIKSPFAIALLAASMLFAQGFAFAADTERLKQTIETERAVSTLAPELNGVTPGGTIWYVFRQELREGWHVYWRNPGDSGLPLEINWSLPEGFSVGDIVYPAPERIPVGPFVNYGHHGDPVFLIPVTAPEAASPGDTADIEATATWLICEEICVPESAEFSLDLAVLEKSAVDPIEAEFAEKARLAQPDPLEGEAAFYADDDGLLLEVTSTALPAKIGDDAYFFIEAEGVVAPNEPQSVRSQNGKLQIDLPIGHSYAAADLAQIDGVLSVGKGRQQRQYSLTALAGEGAPSTLLGTGPSVQLADASSMGVGGVLLLISAAFIGGIILNAMPCVFPIVFVKAASFVQSASGPSTEVKRHGVIYTIGVLFTFVALGGALLALRAGGEQLGWGFHLQSPLVVGLSAYVLLLVGLNFSGVFEIGTGLQNLGSGAASKGGDAGAFFTGVLAVFVAAPCVGPFLSAPVGAAVVLPPVLGMLIFLAMGLGLAAPYLALSFSPALAARLPKPGPWMEIFRQALAFPVFGAAAYFVWILAQQVGTIGLASVFAGLLAIAFAAWLYGLSQKNAGNLKWVALAVGLLAAAPLVTQGNAGASAPEASAAKSAGYGSLETTAYDATAIDAARAEGRGVFVDFTAAWCVICQFNKATILSRRATETLFKANGVSLMVADWTRRDPEITKALEAFGANGVPLYVYFPPVGEPRVLPLPLTKSAIEAAVAGEGDLQASGR